MLLLQILSKEDSSRNTLGHWGMNVDITSCGIFPVDYFKFFWAQQFSERICLHFPRVCRAVENSQFLFKVITHNRVVEIR